MFLCSSCHIRSTCRSEVHLDIVKRKCDGCGYLFECFKCTNVEVTERRAINSEVSIAQYRHTRLLKPYRRIRI